MPAKRKKKKKMKKNEVQVPFPVVLANVLVLVAVLGLSYMWLCSRCDAMGRDIKSREELLNTAQKRLVMEQGRWSVLTAPQNLKNAIHKHGLNMTFRSERESAGVVYATDTERGSFAYIK